MGSEDTTEEHDHPPMMGVYNGKTFKQVELKQEILSHYLAEITYKASEKWPAWYVVAFQLYLNKESLPEYLRVKQPY